MLEDQLRVLYRRSPVRCASLIDQQISYIIKANFQLRRNKFIQTGLMAEMNDMQMGQADCLFMKILNRLFTKSP